MAMLNECPLCGSKEIRQWREKAKGMQSNSFDEYGECDCGWDRWVDGDKPKVNQV